MQPNTMQPKISKIGVYSALLNQTGTNAPTVTILQNTLQKLLDGEIIPITITWTREAAGQYVGTSIVSGLFTSTKTMLLVQKSAALTNIAIVRTGTNAIEVHTTNSSDVSADGLLINTAIEIRVYE